jgi:hypothetical protein
MGKVTVDSKLFTDARFVKLCIKEGSRKQALGALVELWLTAIETVSPENPGGTFSTEKWQSEDLSQHLLAAGFCSISGDEVIVTGGVDAFKWLVNQQVKSRLGGQKSSSRGRNDKGQYVSVDAGTSSPHPAHNQPQAGDQSSLNPATASHSQPSYTYTSTITSISSPTDTSKNAVCKTARLDVSGEIDEDADAKPHRKKNVLTQEAKDLNRKIYDAYERAYFTRYDVNPIRNARVNALISQLRARLGEDAVPVVEFYLKHNSTFYVGKTHSLEYCVKDAESLHLQWRKGKAITNRDLKNYDKTQSSAELKMKIMRGEV